MKEAMLFVKKYNHLFDSVESGTGKSIMPFSGSSFISIKISKFNLSKEVLVEMLEEIKRLKESNVEIELIITYK